MIPVNDDVGNTNVGGCSEWIRMFASVIPQWDGIRWIQSGHPASSTEQQREATSSTKGGTQTSPGAAVKLRESVSQRRLLVREKKAYLAIVYLAFEKKEEGLDWIGTIGEQSSRKRKTKESLYASCFSPKTQAEIRSFSKLRNSKCFDMDGFQTQPITFVIYLLPPILVHIVLKTGSFYKNMQTAKSNHTTQGNDVNNLSNYRSIFLIFSKGLEKTIYSRITSFFEKHLP